MTITMQALYYGIFRAEIIQGNVVFLSPRGKENNPDDFWEVFRERNPGVHQYCTGFVRADNSYRHSCLRFYDEQYVDKSQGFRYNSVDFVPDAHCISVPRAVLRKPELNLEGELLIAASDDGRTVSLWNKKFFLESGCP